MSLTTLPATASLDEIVAIIERDGGGIIEDFLDQVTLDSLNTDLDPLLTMIPTGEDSFVGGGANESDGPRRGMSIGLDRGNLEGIIAAYPGDIGKATTLIYYSGDPIVWADHSDDLLELAGPRPSSAKHPAEPTSSTPR